MKRIAWTLIVVIGVSCKKDPYLDQSVNNELVILAEITAGDSLKVPVSKSIQVGSGGIISFEKVNSAIVKIGRTDGNSISLKLNSSPDYAGDPASIYTAPQKPHYNMTYSLQVQDPLSGTVTATTNIPPPVRVSGFDTTEDYRSGNAVLKCRFTLNDTPGVSRYYVFEAVKQILRCTHYFYWQGVRYNYDKEEGKKLYDQVKNNSSVRLSVDTVAASIYRRLNIYTDDNNVDNAQVSSLDSPFRRIFLPGQTANGSYTTTIYVDKRHFMADKGEDPGRVLIQVKSVSPELYNYLFWYEKYKSDVGSVPTGQLYSPPGNIQNGLGIFGGSSKRQYVYYFDPLK